MRISKCYNCMNDFDIDIDYICPFCGYDQNEQKNDVEKSCALTPGTMLSNKYYIGRVMGIGGSAITYVAYNTLNKSKVAVKEFFPAKLAMRDPGEKEVFGGYGDDLVQFQMGMEQFQKESKQLAQVGAHQGIVDIYETFTENNTAYIAMEFVEGETLQSIMQKKGVMDYKQLLNIIIPVCEALYKVHGNEKILHRDIAPDNIMLQPNGRAKLIDFGASINCAQTNENVILKHGYAPYEQYDENSVCSESTDTYALSASIYHLLTGKRPPRADQRREAVLAGETDPLQSLVSINPDIPQELENVILKGLSIEPQDRFQTAHELSLALSSFVDYKQVLSDDVDQKKVKFKPIFKILIGVAVPLMILIVVFAVIFTKPSQTESVDYGKIPDLSGLTLEEAEERIENENLDSVVTFSILEGTEVDSSDKKQSGVIAMQTPKAGSTISEDQLDDSGNIVVSVNVYKYNKNANSSSDTKIKVPNVVNLSQNEAQKQLKKVGLTKIKIETDYNDEYETGVVYNQSLKAGSSARATSQITIFVSKGTIPTTAYHKPTVDVPKETEQSKGNNSKENDSKENEKPKATEQPKVTEQPKETMPVFEVDPEDEFFNEFENAGFADLDDWVFE